MCVCVCVCVCVRERERGGVGGLVQRAACKVHGKLCLEQFRLKVCLLFYGFNGVRGPG